MRLTTSFMLSLASFAQNSPISWWRTTFKAAILKEEYVGILYPIFWSALKHAYTTYFCTVMSWGWPLLVLSMYKTIPCWLPVLARIEKPIRHCLIRPSIGNVLTLRKSTLKFKIVSLNHGTGWIVYIKELYISEQNIYRGVFKHVTYYACTWVVCPPQCWLEAQIIHIIIWQIRRREFGHIFS